MVIARRIGRLAAGSAVVAGEFTLLLVFFFQIFNDFNVNFDVKKLFKFYSQVPWLLKICRRILLTPPIATHQLASLLESRLFQNGFRRDVALRKYFEIKVFILKYNRF